jgi:hypothetical protein
MTSGKLKRYKGGLLLPPKSEWVVWVTTRKFRCVLGGVACPARVASWVNPRLKIGGERVKCVSHFSPYNCRGGGPEKRMPKGHALTDYVCECVLETDSGRVFSYWHEVGKCPASVYRLLWKE